MNKTVPAEALAASAPLPAGSVPRADSREHPPTIVGADAAIGVGNRDPLSTPADAAIGADNRRTASAAIGSAIGADNRRPLQAAAGSAIGAGYQEALNLVERLHRCLLDLVKDEIDRRGLAELTSTQGLLLFNIGDQALSATELRARGCYLGSNVSYNVKKLVEAGYLDHARSSLDRRAVRISLTPRGREVHAIVQALVERHARSVAPVGGLSASDLEQMNESLARLERFWRDQIRYRL